MEGENNNNEVEELNEKDGKIINREIVDEMKTAYIDYAMSVIVARALPDVRDGLKPVQRRVLHAMYKKDTGAYTKVATLVGAAMEYHPHGDSSIVGAMVQLGQKNYLIDCGGDSDTDAADIAAETLLSQGIARLDGVIVTHYDRDHAGGISNLLSRIPADAVFLPDVPDEDEIVAASGSEFYVREDVSLQWEDNCLTVFAPVISASSNESGLSALFSGGGCDILITDDMSTFGEMLLLHEKRIPKLTALVAGHHGSKSSTGDKLLSATKPDYVLISVGDNSYGHPHSDVLKRLEEYGCTVYRTDLDGTIVFGR